MENVADKVNAAPVLLKFQKFSTLSRLPPQGYYMFLEKEGSVHVEASQVFYFEDDKDDIESTWEYFGQEYILCNDGEPVEVEAVMNDSGLEVNWPK